MLAKCVGLSSRKNDDLFPNHGIGSHLCLTGVSLGAWKPGCKSADDLALTHYYFLQKQSMWLAEGE